MLRRSFPLVDEVADKIRDKAKAKIQQELSGGGLSNLPTDTDENLNGTLIKEASLRALLRKNPPLMTAARTILAKVKDPALSRRLLEGLVLYKQGGWEAVQRTQRFTGRQILAISQFSDQLSQQAFRAGENRIYRTVLAVGGVAPYPNVDSYLAACRRISNRDLTGSEKAALVSKGRLYDLGRNRS